MSRFVKGIRRIFSRSDGPPPDLDATLADLRRRTPAPVFWLLGKTQSGKTSIVKFLTGADEAVIGSGFRPCTSTSRQFQFPTPDAPLVTFLDTRGVDEPGYDPAADLAAFDPLAHVVIVTVKATDFAQGNIRAALEPIRAASASRPVILCVTCLHEAIPRQPLPTPYPFGDCEAASGLEALDRSIAEHRRAFAGLFDTCVPIDLTRPEDGFPDPNYGGEQLKEALLRVLPGAYRQTLLRLKEATDALKDVHLRHAVPIIMGYSTLAATAGGIPLPFVDMVLLPGVQGRMIRHLARIYGQEFTAEQFLKAAGAAGIGLVTQGIVRNVFKLVPVVGWVAGAATAAASTYALGRAFCYYYEAVCEGHVPDAAALKKYYKDEYAAAEHRWKKPEAAATHPTPPSAP